MIGSPEGDPILVFSGVFPMIRNLNQQNFSGFGIISHERPAIAESAQNPEQRATLQLRHQFAPIYRATDDTWLYNTESMTVLSVSQDGNEFQHYYLDKPVCVRAGVYFCLAPFRVSSATAQMSFSQAPEETGKQLELRDLYISNKLRLSALYTFFYHEKERGFVFTGESHPMLELTYVDQGSLHSVAGGQELILNQGEMTIYGPDQWHMQYADMDVAPRYVTISFDVEGCDITPLLNRKFQPQQEVITLLQQMLRERERMDKYTTDMIITLLTQLLLNIMRNIDAPSEKPKASNSLHSDNEIIRRAQQYISEHIREKLSVPILARKVDVSPSYLTSLFHKYLQISPGEYIRRIKLQESKQMIRENSMNFTQIAEVLQYSTVHHFSRQFKDKFGITPTEYARSVR